MREKIGLISLGCSKNTINSEQMLHLLREAGYTLTPDLEAADAVIINTCGFIEPAKREAIETILQTARLKDGGALKKLIVAGCLAERYKGEVLSEFPEVDGLIGCGSFGSVVSAVESCFSGERPALLGDIDAPLDECARVVTGPRHTAYLKISEGCDNRCAYCVIPSLRGRHRSRKMEDILREAEELVKGGAAELIIIAQDITRYGTDLYGKRSLPELLGALCAVPGARWIRLHYLYPDGIDTALIETINKNPNILRYLDIPVQHCDEQLLAAMNRRSPPEGVDGLFRQLRREIPGVVLRTSIITGLPGEGEAEFDRLCGFVREHAVERAGVFPFSPEEGTQAFGMPGIPDEEERARRARIVEELSSRVIDVFNLSRVGSCAEVLCEGFDTELGLYFGRSYAESPGIDGRICFSSETEVAPGEFVNVLLREPLGGDMLGEAVNGILP